MNGEEAIRRRFELLDPHLDERPRRLTAAAEAEAMGFGGVSAVARATGVSRLRLCRGIKERKEASESPRDGGRIRRPGGGRKKTVETDLALKADLEKLVQPTGRGEPETPLRWTCKSVRR